MGINYKFSKVLKLNVSKINYMLSCEKDFTKYSLYSTKKLQIR